MWSVFSARDELFFLMFKTGCLHSRLMHFCALETGAGLGMWETKMYLPLQCSLISKEMRTICEMDGMLYNHGCSLCSYSFPSPLVRVVSSFPLSQSLSTISIVYDWLMQNAQCVLTLLLTKISSVAVLKTSLHAQTVCSQSLLSLMLEFLVHHVMTILLLFVRVFPHGVCRLIVCWWSGRTFIKGIHY